VLFTGVAGWLFGWLNARSGSLAAPMLAHLAVNEAAALAALGVKRRAKRRAGRPRADAAR
jgi:membrane protease YdiL (CAAX protease family)